MLTHCRFRLKSSANTEYLAPKIKSRQVVWLHRLTAMLGFHHLTELQKPGGANARVMNQRNSNHTNRWIHVTRLLGQ